MPRNTGTILTDSQGNNRTATHLSTNIVIMVDGNAIGAVQDLQVRESRDVRMIDECGTDGHIDSTPTSSANVEGSCNRIRFDKMRIAEAFSRPYIHGPKSQRRPFDIEIHDFFADADPGNAIITVIKNVWITGIEYTYKASEFVISDNMSWKAEDIYSILNNGPVARAVTNGRSNPITLNQFEQEADSGRWRGALDFPNLIDAFLSDPRF